MKTADVGPHNLNTRQKGTAKRMMALLDSSLVRGWLLVGGDGGVKYSWNRFTSTIPIDVHLKYEIRNTR